MKRQILATGLLSLTAVSIITSCVDDKYDLSDIDTTSRFTVDDLTIPVNLSEIKLENVINLDDNENISTIGGKYAISKGGDIDPTEFNIGSVTVSAPYIPEININVNNPLQSGITLPEVPATSINIGQSDLKSYDFSMNNIDKALKVLRGVKTPENCPISIEVKLTVPSELLGSDNTIAFKKLKLQMPTDLIMQSTDIMTYDPTNGEFCLKEDLNVDEKGQASFTIDATGLELGTEKGTVQNGNLSISGEVGVLGGELYLDLKNVTLPSVLDIKTKFEVSGFELASFSGTIDYQMDNIEIDPISLSDLPDFLDSPQTNLIIANPEINIAIKNPVAKYDLVGNGKLTLTSTFANGESIIRSSDDFKIKQNADDGWCYISLTKNPTDEATGNYQFSELGYVLSNKHLNDPNNPSEGWGLPETIAVSVENLSFAGDVSDFPLGDLGVAEGSYEFKAPLGFGNGSMVIYESTEDGWGSEDLDKVNIQHVKLNALCTTNLPVSVYLEVFPIASDGHEIEVAEKSEFIVPANAVNVPVKLNIVGKNGSIKDFDGVRFKATVAQDGGNTEAIGPDLFIKLNNLQVTVDGYYDTDF